MTPFARFMAAALFGLLLLTIPRWVMESPRQQEMETTEARVAALQSEVDALRRDNARLVAEVEALSDDPWTIERRAREEQFYVHDDEVVLVFRDSGRPDAATAATTR